MIDWHRPFCPHCLGQDFQDEKAITRAELMAECGEDPQGVFFHYGRAWFVCPCGYECPESGFPSLLQLAERADEAFDFREIRFGGIIAAAVGAYVSGEAALVNADTMIVYLDALRDRLNSFIGLKEEARHEVAAVRGEDSAMVSVRVVSGEASPPAVMEAGSEGDGPQEATRQRLLSERTQPLRTGQSLRTYRDGGMYLLKPLGWLDWTRRQAAIDAREVIAETLGSGGP